MVQKSTDKTEWILSSCQDAAQITEEFRRKQKSLHC